MEIDARRKIANRVEDAVHAFATSNQLPIHQLSVSPDRDTYSFYGMRLRTIMPEGYNKEIDRIAKEALKKIAPNATLFCSLTS